MIKMIDVDEPHGQPSLEGPEHGRLSWTSVQRTACVETVLELIRIMLAPVACEYVLVVATEGFIFPPLHRAT